MGMDARTDETQGQRVVVDLNPLQHVLLHSNVHLEALKAGRDDGVSLADRLDQK
jgi:hypothetical protein